MAVIVAAAVAAETGLTVAVAERLREACLPIIEQYSPGAPDTVKSEALLRMASHMDASLPGLALRQMKVGDGITVDFRAAGSSLRLSGASALLSPWRRRTVGRCEAAE